MTLDDMMRLAKQAGKVVVYYTKRGFRIVVDPRKAKKEDE